MSDEKKTGSQFTRRTLFKGAGMIAGGAAIAAGRAAAQETKFSQEDAEYQDEPNDRQSCSNCALFVAPSSCTVVDGEVAPEGWCKYWASI